MKMNGNTEFQLVFVNKFKYNLTIVHLKVIKNWMPSKKQIFILKLKCMCYFLKMLQILKQR